MLNANPHKQTRSLHRFMAHATNTGCSLLHVSAIFRHRYLACVNPSYGGVILTATVAPRNQISAGVKCHTLVSCTPAVSFTN